MNLRAAMLVRRFNRLPRSVHLALTAGLCLLLYIQAERFGESIGKALYYLTH